MSKIKVSNLKKSYYIANKEFNVLNDLNIEFNPGEVVAIYGESGSGKSTLMNVLGGLDTFDEGNITFDSHSIKDFTNKSMDYYRNKKIGFVFQEFNLIENLSLIDNVLLPLDIAGINKKESKARAIELLKKVGLGSQIKKKVNQLSGGQKQRVAIARALANEPDIILADEPTGALDSETQVSILELLTEISNQGTCVVIITHSPDVANYATRIVNLKDGKIIDQQPIVNSEVKESELLDGRDSNLSLKKAFKIAFKNLFSKKIRTILVAIAISLGITGSLLITSLSEEAVDEFKASVGAYETNPNNASAYFFPFESPKEEDYTLEEVKRSSQSQESSVKSYVEANEEISEYSIVEKISEQNVINYYKLDLDEYFSIDTNHDGPEHTTVKYGRYPQTEREVIFMGELADFTPPPGLESLFESIFSEENLNLIDISGKNDIYNDMTSRIKSKMVGSKFTLETDKGPQEFTIVGSKELTYVNMSLGLGDSLFQMPYHLNKDYLDSLDNSLNKYYSSKVVFKFDNKNDRSDFIDSKSLFIPETSGSFAVVIIDFDMVTNLMITVFDIITGVFLSLTAISIVVSVFMVAMIVYVSTLERKKEIGTLRALGAKKSNIKTIFIFEGLLIGLLGFIFAVIASLVSIWLINFILIYSNFIDEPAIGLSYKWAFTFLALIVVTMFLASLYPSTKASRQNPIDALREE